MVYAEMMKCMALEKDLVEDLIPQLKLEIDLIITGDVDALEESMPAKQALLEKIAANRRTMPEPRDVPGSDEAAQMRCLQQDLVGLWKKVGGMNELSKQMIGRRLDEIRHQLGPFLARQGNGYDRAGRTATLLTHTIIPGA